MSSFLQISDYKRTQKLRDYSQQVAQAAHILHAAQIVKWTETPTAILLRRST
jgi:hypothetical protein